MLMLPTTIKRTSICTKGRRVTMRSIPPIPKESKETKQRYALVVKEEVTPSTELFRECGIIIGRV